MNNWDPCWHTDCHKTAVW